MIARLALFFLFSLQAQPLFCLEMEPNLETEVGPKFKILQDMKFDLHLPSCENIQGFMTPARTHQSCKNHAKEAKCSFFNYASRLEAEGDCKKEKENACYVWNCKDKQVDEFLTWSNLHSYKEVSKLINLAGQYLHVSCVDVAGDSCMHFCTMEDDSKPVLLEPNLRQTSKSSAAAEFLGQSRFTVQGDPHVTNMAGDKFNIAKTGSQVALQIPRDESRNLLLKVQMNIIQQGSNACDKLFANKIELQGSLLGPETQMVKFIADRDFSVLVNGIAETFQQKKQWVFLENAHVEDWVSSKPVSTKMTASLGFSGRRKYTVKFGGAILQVEEVTHKRFHFLNMQLAGLSHMKQSIGGFLGLEEHDSITKRPEECNRKPALSSSSSDPGFSVSIE